MAKEPTPAQESPSDGSHRNIFYGWWIVFAGSMSQAYTSGAFWQGFGAFFDPIVEHFGWGKAITGAAVSLQRTESGLISPFVGWFIERFGPRNVMLFGVIATGLGFILLSRINNLWQFYAAFAIITVGLSFGSFLTVTTTVANWFVNRRARALAIMSAGSGIGGLLVPLIVWFIATTDWRTGLVAIGVGFMAVGLPVAFVMRSRPEDYGLLPDGARPNDDGSGAGGTSGFGAEPEAAFTTRQAMATLTFWQMALAMGGGQLIISASVYQISAMSSFGVSRTVGGMVIMAVSIIGLMGRLTSGFFGDQLDKRYVLAVSFAMQFVGTLLFAFIGGTWHLIGFIVFWGIGFGVSIPIRFAMLADLFGRRHFGSIMGIMMTFSTVFGVVGPIMVGWMADYRGSYREPYVILAVAVLVCIPLILTVKQPQTATPAEEPVRT
ncbi:MAG: MFS transporter [SAR202 cluster bacterium]|nr:hypothetical protein [Chloroflexota bacterium]MDP6421892.1 MFS transporter [SAR202 cluster bacterium]HAL46272.1 hypothetical protein [Dehalococcoidia bacterium]MDP6665204.1 MFS transporter [SAR202 cluster bacterium]MDP6799301.1 MFS transporter [SAR202 cluster bacterium]